MKAYENKLSDHCDVAYAMTLLSGKWKISIIWELRHEPLRLSALRRRLLNISEAVLINQLREMEHDGLILRTVFKEIPPHVEYRLTKHSINLLDSLQQIESWGKAVRTTS